MVWPLVEQLLLHQLTNEGMTCSPKKWRALRLTPISRSADFPYPMVKNLQINFVTEESPGMWGCISERREWMLSMTVFLWGFFLAGDFQSRLFKTTLPPQYTESEFLQTDPSERVTLRGHLGQDSHLLLWFSHQGRDRFMEHHGISRPVKWSVTRVSNA